MPILELNPRQRSELRSAAHALRPVVLIGDKGLSAAVLAEIDRALTAHGLIKVRAGGEDRSNREQMLDALCTALSCATVHHLGKTFVLFRPQPALAARSEPDNAHRAKRRTQESYTPKKLAAEGKISQKKRPGRPAAEARARTRKTVAAKGRGAALHRGSASSLRPHR